ncbi:MAG: hypothetical protein EZS28_008890 [Streblomastix strix]|uniref:Rapamycin-insensitive companion of mTOR N-terminal domain-containing protein n=1 Tax=Streblomastix strix TaxID=222440 RepID=A0A5J4WL83_9EUKA|nr:MAG: hypothetical protein EZS28_008890 [Streblomastix strix]
MEKIAEQIFSGRQVIADEALGKIERSQSEIAQKKDIRDFFSEPICYILRFFCYSPDTTLRRRALSAVLSFSSFKRMVTRFMELSIDVIVAIGIISNGSENKEHNLCVDIALTWIQTNRVFAQPIAHVACVTVASNQKKQLVKCHELFSRLCYLFPQEMRSLGGWQVLMTMILESQPEQSIRFTSIISYHLRDTVRRKFISSSDLQQLFSPFSLYAHGQFPFSLTVIRHSMLDLEPQYQLQQEKSYSDLQQMNRGNSSAHLSRISTEKSFQSLRQHESPSSTVVQNDQNMNYG